MTALLAALVPGAGDEPTALVVAEYQAIACDSPLAPQGERWVVRDAIQWAPGISQARVARQALQVAQALGCRLAFDRTGVGEVYADLLATEVREGRTDVRARGYIFTAGNFLPGQAGTPRDWVLRRFEARLIGGRVLVDPACSLGAEVRRRLERFAHTRTRAGEAPTDALLFAMMMATGFRQAGARYVARDGRVYESRAASPDAY